MLTLEHVVSSYQRYAPWYDRLFGRVLEPGRQALCHTVAKVQPQTLLEIGVGTGLTLFNYPQDINIVGIDISEEMLKFAREKTAALNNPRIQLAAMDAENLNFADHSFDCVTLPYVLSVTPNPARLVAEMRRVCRVGGDIIIVNHFSGNGVWLTLEKLAKPFAAKIGFNSEFSYEQHIKAHDWTIQSVHQVNLFGLSKIIHIKNQAHHVS
jgi:phosphatidylethanolamine/phosphatidyl-N-methylethanolamine N-methyltransferase